MQFIKATNSDQVVAYVTEILSSHLRADEKVLWLLSGGSAIEIEVAVAKGLSGLPVDDLTISLMDERFGPVGHKDSNWKQLEAAGFEVPGAALIPVLNSLDEAETTSIWGNALDSLLTTDDFRLGVLGIGPDGHTSGILPHSGAVEARSVAFAYAGGGYSRITTTIPAIRRLDEVVVYAFGEAKRAQLERLLTDTDVADQPAQLLKQLDKVTIFSDVIGEQS